MERRFTDPALDAIRRQVQNREPLRLTMLFALFAMLAVLSLGRRVLGDETLQGGALAARITLLIGGILYCAKCIQVVTRENEAGRVLGDGFWSTTAGVEMALVVAMFVANQFFCELNESIEQLGSPIVLMIPLLIALSAVAGSSAATDLLSLARALREGQDR
ncbi:MAG: hypothetical protein FJ292_06850 [Planctomycetes bacterium]|nr:hypothetical protein [Planctomycetota bacterium]